MIAIHVNVNVTVYISVGVNNDGEVLVMSNLMDEKIVINCNC